MLVPKVCSLIWPWSGDLVLIGGDKPGEGISYDDKLVDVRVAVLAMYLARVVPIGEALTLTEQRLEATASVLGDVTVHDGLGVEVVDVSGDVEHGVGGAARSDGAPLGVVRV
ncbi:Carbohydrate sulfotransferase [Gracilaria domingensis]|nr:Carbohydrate sulfotransferase [Gracilaria domingensis]